MSEIKRYRKLIYSKEVIHILTDETLSRLYDSGYEEEIKEINDILEKHGHYYLYKLVPLPEKPKRLLGQNGLHFLQMSLFRSRNLIEGYLSSINSNNPLNAALTTRAHFEITGAVAYFLKRLNSFYEGNIDFERLEDVLKKLNLGVKIKGELTEAPDPINVMAMIDAADEVLRKISKSKDKIFRTLYDDLSEICHPNSFGLQLSGYVNKVGVIRYKNSTDLFSMDKFFIHNFSITVSAFMMFYEDARELIENNEEIPKIVDN